MTLIKTPELAELFGVKPISILQAHSRRKNYQGLVPRKLPCGQLRWCREEAIAILHGEKPAA